MKPRYFTILSKKINSSTFIIKQSKPKTQNETKIKKNIPK